MPALAQAPALPDCAELPGAYDGDDAVVAELWELRREEVRACIVARAYAEQAHDDAERAHADAGRQLDAVKLAADQAADRERGDTADRPLHVLAPPAPEVGTVALDAGSRTALTQATASASADLHSDLWFLIGLASIAVPGYLLARVVMPRA